MREKRAIDWVTHSTPLGHIAMDAGASTIFDAAVRNAWSMTTRSS